MAVLPAPPFIPRASYPSLVLLSMSSISASEAARQCLKPEQKSTTRISTVEYTSRKINGESGPAGHRTDVRVEAAIQRGD